MSVARRRRRRSLLPRRMSGGGSDQLDRRDLADTDTESHYQVVAAVEAPAAGGPNLGRPHVDLVKGSTMHILKELRPGSAGRSECRILFAFDPWRDAVLLIAGDKSGRWKEWYRWAIPRAEQLYEEYVKERAAEEERS